MRTKRPAFLVVVVALAVCDSLWAQSAGNLRSRRSAQLNLYAPRDANRHLTRLDLVRLRLARDPRYKGFLRPPPPIMDPISAMLFERNLLTARSPLADRTGAMIGRNDYSAGAGTRWRGAYEPLDDPEAALAFFEKAKANDISFPDLIQTSLGKKAEEAYAQGIAYFRGKDYLRARNQFELVKHIEPDLPRGYMGDMLVSMKRGDGNRAYVALLRAIERGNELDDLRVDRDTFFSTTEEFHKDFDRINLKAKENADSGADNLLLAMYAALNNDLGIARPAAQAAVRAFEQREKEVETSPLKDPITGVPDFPALAKKLEKMLEDAAAPKTGLESGPKATQIDAGA